MKTFGEEKGKENQSPTMAADGPSYKVASIIVSSLHNAGVNLVFGIPGAKIDALFDALSDHPSIHLIICRHEQNAAFMAAAVGRLTGIPGVCIATSGPGAANLTTGLLTATTEGDPVMAIVGAVPRVLSTKHTHQSMKALQILGPAGKSAVQVDVEDQTAEACLASFRVASTNPKGAAVLSLPMDLAAGTSRVGAFPAQAFTPPPYGPAPEATLRTAVDLLAKAHLPVFFLGQRASSPAVVSAVRTFLRAHPIAVVETFQAAGAVPQDLAEEIFFGRVGLFRNQPGDRLLAHADLIVAIGYDPTEYDAHLWNPSGNLRIVHVDFLACDYGAHYRPVLELLGSVRENVIQLGDRVTAVASPAGDAFCRGLSRELREWSEGLATALPAPEGPVHPLHFVATLQRHVDPDTTVACDVGTVYIYMMRYFRAYQPRALLCSNGQQTLGVGLPWAIAASLVQTLDVTGKRKKVISLSGDGGFMFSSQELATAVQQGCNITHFVWNDEGYNMVEFQEEMRYGRASGVRLGGVAFARLAEAFGAKGLEIRRAGEMGRVMEEALGTEGVVVVDVRIDYTRVQELAGNLIQDSVR